MTGAKFAPTEAELRDSIVRIEHVRRRLHPELHKAEEALRYAYSDDEQRRAEERVIGLRRELVRVGDAVNADLARSGHDKVIFQDGLAYGGAIYSVPLIEALIGGASTGRNLTPMVMDPTYEAAVAWRERQIDAARERDIATAEARAGRLAVAAERDQKRAEASAARQAKLARRRQFLQRHVVLRWIAAMPGGLAIWSDFISVGAWCWRVLQLWRG